MDIGNPLHICVRRHVIRFMDSVIGQVEKKGLCRVTIDEINSFSSESISQIFVLDNRRFISQKFGVIVRRARVQKPKELIKTPPGWIKLRNVSQMPFADCPA